DPDVGRGDPADRRPVRRRARELRRALLEWKVLFFRDQDIDDLLPEDLRARIATISRPSTIGSTRSAAGSPPVETVEMLRPVFPPVVHPVVRVIPETGRRVLFVNSVFTQRIVGVSEEESNEILRALYRHVQRPEFQVRLHWSPDTIAFWDNRTCQHYASSDYFPARRVMDRISIVGDKPVGVTA
ncbi:hypothetical protein GS880_00810, partial [Rhodococcus hoagii]|nr:hypothetical protein [Prescottella equi]